ncbi:unnamed protein product, partial [Sphagnum compactum]
MGDPGSPDRPGGAGDRRPESPVGGLIGKTFRQRLRTRWRTVEGTPEAQGQP